MVATEKGWRPLSKANHSNQHASLTSPSFLYLMIDQITDIIIFIYTNKSPHGPLSQQSFIISSHACIHCHTGTASAGNYPKFQTKFDDLYTFNIYTAIFGISMQVKNNFLPFHGFSLFSYNFRYCAEIIQIAIMFDENYPMAKERILTSAKTVVETHEWNQKWLSWCQMYLTLKPWIMSWHWNFHS